MQNQEYAEYLDYITKRIIEEKSIPQYLKNEFDDEISMNDFLECIFDKRSEFFDRFDEIEGDMESVYIAKETGYSEDAVDLVLWFDECFYMKSGSCYEYDRCIYCAHNMLIRQEGDGLYQIDLICEKCKKVMTYEDLDVLHTLDFEPSVRIPLQPKVVSKVTDKSYVFKVATGYRRSIWRKIKISTGATLTDFCSAIIDSFEFDHEHLFSFYMNAKGRKYSTEYYNGSFYDDNEEASRTLLEMLNIEAGAKFFLLYDFGDEWHFWITLEQEIEETTEIPEVLASKNESPPQYYYNDMEEEL